MLKRIGELIEAGKSFGFETTLAGRGYVKMLQQMEQLGYRIHLYFLWLPSPTVALARVQQRFRKGGHNITEDVIRRRFEAGLKNFFEIYQPLVDDWVLWDASPDLPTKIASLGKGRLHVHDDPLYNQIIDYMAKQ